MTPEPRPEVVDLLVELFEARVMTGADDERLTSRQRWSTGDERAAAIARVLSTVGAEIAGYRAKRRSAGRGAAPRRVQRRGLAARDRCCAVMLSASAVNLVGDRARDTTGAADCAVSSDPDWAASLAEAASGPATPCHSRLRPSAPTQIGNHP
ncbi:MAG TPA: hypothetical protein VFH38_09395 [Jatrophihabitans sp.]|nr:hypothetical protein [Jatrophihabitans sp.]